MILFSESIGVFFSGLFETFEFGGLEGHVREEVGQVVGELTARGADFLRVGGVSVRRCACGGVRRGRRAGGELTRQVASSLGFLNGGCVKKKAPIWSISFRE